MNYQRVYDNLIQSAQLRPDIAFLNGYTEKHHILPQCLGGPDDLDNIVKLTAREHFIAHWLLFCIHPKNRKLKYAFNAMCMRGKDSKRYYSSRGFAIARKAAAEACSADKKGKAAWNRGKEHSAEHRAKISATKKGKKHSAEAKAKMSATKKGKKHSAEHRAKISAAKKGKKHSAERRAKISATKKGKEHSAEHRAKISAAKKGKRYSPAYQRADEIKADRAAGMSLQSLRKKYHTCNKVIKDIIGSA
jgi:hypothetical protein